MMNIPFTRKVNGEEETAETAKEFSAILSGGDVISINGNLGAGKTFFIKNVCMQCGIHNVNSPTFAIVNEYNGLHKVYHFDFYRLNNVNELLDIGITDYLIDEEAVIFIEWGNTMKEVLPVKRIDIEIEMLTGNQRNIKITINEQR